MVVNVRSDGLIEFIVDHLSHSFVLDAMAATAGDTWTFVEELIIEHIELGKSGDTKIDVRRSRLAKAVPSVSSFLTPLPLRAAWNIYDSKYKVSQRRFVQPGFDDVRHVLNLAQVRLKSRHNESPCMSAFCSSCFLVTLGDGVQEFQIALDHV